jgi:hypothetical protein
MGRPAEAMRSLPTASDFRNDLLAVNVLSSKKAAQVVRVVRTARVVWVGHARLFCDRRIGKGRDTDSSRSSAVRRRPRHAPQANAPGRNVISADPPGSKVWRSYTILEADRNVTQLGPSPWPYR